MSRKGWYGEPKRHGLSTKGIKNKKACGQTGSSPVTPEEAERHARYILDLKLKGKNPTSEEVIKYMSEILLFNDNSMIRSDAKKISEDYLDSKK